MLFLLSPAKSLDDDTRVPAAVLRRATEPLFPQRAAALIEILRRQSPAELASLMDLSDALAALNVGRYAAWQSEATLDNSKPAVLAFNGDVYEGLQARSLKAADLDWAQQHLVILSGLYGVLRPLDRLQPYRLEMGTALATPSGRNLYEYWGDTLAGYLNERLAAERSPVIINLASQEYARAALRPSLQARVIHCQFEEGRQGRYGIISFFAKRARGLMARWAIEHRVRKPQALQAFDGEGYAFDPQASAPDRWVFRRTSAG
ncbi:MAG: peroxide stress protein YaaA [Rubrivivax sp.]|nr:peroxide stress protein YaaA [Rubrivivax sp.]